MNETLGFFLFQPIRFVIFLLQQLWKLRVELMYAVLLLVSTLSTLLAVGISSQVQSSFWWIGTFLSLLLIGIIYLIRLKPTYLSY